MKRYGFLVTMIFISSLLFTGCGNSSNGNGVADDGEDDPIVVIPGGGDTGDDPIVVIPGDDTGDADTIDPVISIVGDNPVTIGYGETYTDAGATATDNVDGVVNVATSGTVDTSTIGSYTITYTATDSAGNTATAIRTVNVVDDIAPEIKIKGKNPTTITLGDVYEDKGATATDDVDGDLTSSIVATSTVNENETGTYTVTYTVEDSAGNEATAVRTVIVEADEIAPVLTLLGQNPQTMLVGTLYEELGAKATDNIDGTLIVDIDNSDLDVNTVGTYTIVYTATDSAGNTATETRTVNVIADISDDNTAPTITLLGANPQTIFLDDDYIELGATAIDDFDGDLTSAIVIDASDVNTSAEGNYTVTYEVEDTAGNLATAIRDVYVRDVIQPPSPTGDITSTTLACDTTEVIPTSADPGVDTNESEVLKRNISSSSTDDANRQNPTSHNTIMRLDAVVPAMVPNADESGTYTLDENDTNTYHPIVVNYTQQIVGDYEMGDGSADIGDPEHVDGVFVSVSLDNGDKWKNYGISDTTDKSSIQVVWDIDKNAQKIDYPGHAQKPAMAVKGNNILVAWNDKYCPSGNPHNLEPVEVDGNITYPMDYFSVNGKQRSIDYAEAQDGSREEMIAPNGKYVYEVPFSCVWTARGFFNAADGSITWTSPMQLTTGARDSNHIKIAASEAGFALAWQEDTVGLKSGKGEGPGDGWSGATTGHGTDIWYTSIKMEDFDDLNGTDEETLKPKSLYNFHYPVRITDNEKCQEGDTKLYCNYMCDTYGSVDSNQSNNSGTEIKRCLTYDIDMLTDTQVVLDGDTGASRPAINIFKNTDGQHVVVFGYEETKGLSESTPGEGDQDQGDAETIIALEGKSVYFESFLFEAINEVNLSKDFATIMNTAKIPLISAGNIVNEKVPDRLTGEMIYENARRLVIGTQIDSCDADRFNFAFMYKQSFETQGASSDMFIKVNNGLTYDSFTDLDGLSVTNISAQNYKVVDSPADYTVTWDNGNLDDNTYENDEENTFSPRIFLRGNDIFTGYAYTPNEIKTKEEHMPSNFHAHIYLGDIVNVDERWQGPENVTQVVKADVTTVDARFFTTPKGSAAGVDAGVESDASNPNILFVTWGTVEGLQEERAEADIYFKRALKVDGAWEWDTNDTMIAARDGSIIQEKEVGSFASPDGKTIYNIWLQEVELDNYDDSDPFHGLDSWFGRVDINDTIVPVP